MAVQYLGTVFSIPAVVLPRQSKGSQHQKSELEGMRETVQRKDIAPKPQRQQTLRDSPSMRKPASTQRTENSCSPILILTRATGL